MNPDRVIAVRTGKTIYRDGENCIKTFDGDYSVPDVFSEALKQSLAAEAGLNAPAIKGGESVNGRLAIVSEFIRGETMEAAMREHSAKKDEYLRRMAALQYGIHKKEGLFFETFKRKAAEKIKISEADEDVKQKLLRAAEALPEGKSSLHGDLTAANVVFGDDGRDYVLDWAHAENGEPAADAAITYLSFLLKDGEEKADKYLACFCSLSGESEAAVRKYIPLAAAVKAARSNEDERKALLKIAADTI